MICILDFKVLDLLATEDGQGREVIAAFANDKGTVFLWNLSQGCLLVEVKCKPRGHGCSLVDAILLSDLH